MEIARFAHCVRAFSRLIVPSNRGYNINAHIIAMIKTELEYHISTSHLSIIKSFM